MGEAPQIQLPIIDANSVGQTNGCNQYSPNTTPHRSYKWWLLMAIYSVFVLAGQAVATLLGRLYYDKGGNNKWVATLVQLAGFPVLIPFYYLSSYKITLRTETNSSNNVMNRNRPPSLLVLSAIFIALGILLTGDCLLYSVGLQYLPVSTVSLIFASQLGFNAFFSFFINSQKFTPYIINSLVLLTISSILLVFQNDSSGGSAKVPKGKYVIGFICTVASSAGCGLYMSLTQFYFRKVLKKQTFKVVLDVMIYPPLVATLIVVVGLFASGDWKSLENEMEEFELGKASYVITLVWITVSWQVFSIGSTGLIFQVSSLFSNVIITVGLPIVPFLAMIFFHDAMTGIKVISMVLAIWGFVSYIYQHHLDDQTGKE